MEYKSVRKRDLLYIKIVELQWMCFIAVFLCKETVYEMTKVLIRCGKSVKVLENSNTRTD